MTKPKADQLRYDADGIDRLLKATQTALANVIEQKPPQVILDFDSDACSVRVSVKVPPPDAIVEFNEAAFAEYLYVELLDALMDAQNKATGDE